MTVERLLLFAVFSGLFAGGFIHWMEMPQVAGWTIWGGLNMLNLVMGGRW